MPKISKSAIEQELDTPLTQAVEGALANIAITTSPVLICGVNRKINIGNFENIDVYAGIALPLEGLSFDDKTKLTEIVQDAAVYAFGLVSKETGDRYALIKESQSGK
jgi:hypothetical protein